MCTLSQPAIFSYLFYSILSQTKTVVRGTVVSLAQVLVVARMAVTMAAATIINLYCEYYCTLVNQFVFLVLVWCSVFSIGYTAAVVYDPVRVMYYFLRLYLFVNIMTVRFSYLSNFKLKVIPA